MKNFEQFLNKTTSRSLNEDLDIQEGKQWPEFTEHYFKDSYRVGKPLTDKNDNPIEDSIVLNHSTVAEIKGGNLKIVSSRGREEYVKVTLDEEALRLLKKIL